MHWAEEIRAVARKVTAEVAGELSGIGVSAPGLAALTRDGARLLLNQPGVGSAGQSPGEGLRPRPGGWNRMQIEVDDLDAAMAKLRRAGRSFRGAPTAGKGGRQALVEDPSGNVVELFEQAGS